MLFVTNNYFNEEEKNIKNTIYAYAPKRLYTQNLDFKLGLNFRKTLYKLIFYTVLLIKQNIYYYDNLWYTDNWLTQN